MLPSEEPEIASSENSQAKCPTDSLTTCHKCWDPLVSSEKGLDSREQDTVLF